MSEAERKLKEKIAKFGYDPTQIISEVRECPGYFIDEGGADGTFAHMEFLDEYSELMPEILDYAIECDDEQDEEV